MMQPATLRVLTAAGWQPERQVDVAPAVRSLEAAGYAPWTSLVALLEPLVDLRVPITRNGRPDAFWFDPARAAEFSFRSWVGEYERRAGKPLVPVGFAHHDHLLLLVAPDGFWYGGYDDTFGVVGSNAEEMLSALVEGAGLRPLDEPGSP